MSTLKFEVPDVVSADAFRDVMGTVCAPVTVVTARTAEGNPYGTTVSAFSSLSLSPPLVTVALDNESRLLAHIRGSGQIGVNVLAHDQRGIAGVFARSGGDKFAGMAWSWEGGLPRVDGVAAWLVGDVEELVPGGDHALVLAKVRCARTWPTLPLVYVRGRFGTHTSLQADIASG